MTNQTNQPTLPEAIALAREAIRLILPMAKSHAFSHPVGRNAEYCQQATEALAALDSVQVSEPVARICSGWQILFIGSEPISRIVDKHRLKIGDALYSTPQPCARCAELEAQRVEAIQRGDDLVVKNIALEQDNFRLAAGHCIVDGGLCGDEHGNQYCSLQQQFYRKVVVPISLDGSVTEERYVRCEKCYETVTELFVSKKTHDTKLAALEAANANLKKQIKGMATQSEAAIAQQDAALDDVRRLTRELDVIWNGEVAAQQASLCDMVSQIRMERTKQAEQLAAAEKDAERWKAVESACGALTLRIHNCRTEERKYVIDAAIAASKEPK